MPQSREGEAAGRRVDAYLNTVKRLEPDITPLDQDAALASIAISLRRIADALSAPKDFRAGWKAAEGELAKTGEGPPRLDNDEDLRWVALLLSTRRPWRE